MAIVVQYAIPGMTAEQYNISVADLEAAGQGNPDGRVFHVAAPTADGFLVLDVWDTQADLDNFSMALTPILNAAGVATVAPTVLQAHSTILGPLLA